MTIDTYISTWITSQLPCNKIYLQTISNVNSTFYRNNFDTRRFDPKNWWSWLHIIWSWLHIICSILFACWPNDKKTSKYTQKMVFLAYLIVLFYWPFDILLHFQTLSLLPQSGCISWMHQQYTETWTPIKLRHWSESGYQLMHPDFGSKRRLGYK